MQEHHVPGAVVAVVKDGALYLARGYGSANLEKCTPVDVNRTLFRPGSSSKLITWTAVMQLVEKRVLDLDADVNIYLKNFQIPPKDGEPVTLRQLMTHTAGFEDNSIGLFSDEYNLPPYGEFIKQQLPARIYAPGYLYAYSNYGPDLAGYLVEQISGIAFEQYVQENIFNPLEMEDSTLVQPLPDRFMQDMSYGYIYAGGRYLDPVPFEYIRARAAGVMTTTAIDMANFMIAHLQNGRFKDVQILNEETTETMHATQFRQDPDVDGWALGFAEYTLNNERILWHTGGTACFSSILVLFPEQDLGLFISTNSNTGTVLRERIILDFIDRFFPVSVSPVPQPPEDFHIRAKHYQGYYLNVRTSLTTREKIVRLINQNKVTATQDNLLELSSPTGKSYWVETEPLHFRAVEGHATLHFREDNRGNIELMFYGDRLFSQGLNYIKVPWYLSAPLHMAVLAVCVVLLFAAIIVLPVQTLVQRKKVNTVPRYARAAAMLLSVINLVYLAVVVVMSGDPKITQGYSFPYYSRYLFLLPKTSLLFTAIVILFMINLWKGRFWSVSGRIYYTALAVAATVYLLFLLYYNLF
jgi:CubicO group peptidase (beta-lactamase class C family)